MKCKFCESIVKKGNICPSCRVNRKNKKLKSLLLDRIGRKCQRCNQITKDNRLHFHHIISEEKEFRISGNHCRSWSAIKKELEKCCLVCFDCHIGIHHKGYDCPKSLTISFTDPRLVLKIHKITIYNKICDNCKIKFETDDKRRRYCKIKCRAWDSRKCNWPTKEELIKLVWSIPTTQIAKKYGVSDKAVTKWCKNYEIDKPPRGYWSRIGAKSNVDSYCQ